MKASEHGHVTSGVGKFWVARGSNPETYSYGSFDTAEDAEAEARQSMGEDGYVVMTVGEGEEVELNTPDADDIIERITEGVYEQCGETSSDYLDHHAVSQEQRNELTDAVEKTVAEWMTKHNLWPTFCRVEQVKTVRMEDGTHTEG